MLKGCIAMLEKRLNSDNFKKYCQMVGYDNKIQKDFAMEKLFNNYYHYVDKIVFQLPTKDVELKRMVRIIAERELKSRIRTYFSKKHDSTLSGYLNTMMSRLGKKFENYSDILLYLMISFPESKETLTQLMIKHYTPMINAFLEKQNRRHDVNARISCIIMLKKLIEERLSLSGLQFVKNGFMNKYERCLASMNGRDLTGLEKDFNPLSEKPVNLDLLKQKYSYLVFKVFNKYNGMLDDESAFALLYESYNSLVERYVKENSTDNMPHYLATRLTQRLRTLNNRGVKTVKKYKKLGEKCFENWNQGFSSNESALNEYYENVIKNFVKSGSYTSMDLEKYLLISMMRFDLDTALSLERIKQYYVDGSYNVFDMEKRRNV